LYILCIELPLCWSGDSTSPLLYYNKDTSRLESLTKLSLNRVELFATGIGRFRQQMKNQLKRGNDITVLITCQLLDTSDRISRT